MNDFYHHQFLCLTLREFDSISKKIELKLVKFQRYLELIFKWSWFEMHSALLETVDICWLLLKCSAYLKYKAFVSLLIVYLLKQLLRLFMKGLLIVRKQMIYICIWCSTYHIINSTSKPFVQKGQINFFSDHSHVCVFAV